MITFFSTDITLIVLFTAGLALGYLVGNNKRLTRENRELRAKQRLVSPAPSAKYTNTEPGR